jgi:hypothetical protein
MSSQWFSEQHRKMSIILKFLPRFNGESGVLKFPGGFPHYQQYFWRHSSRIVARPFFSYPQDEANPSYSLLLPKEKFLSNLLTFLKVFRLVDSLTDFDFLLD